MIRGETGVHAFQLPMPEVKQPDEVLVHQIVRYNQIVVSNVNSNRSHFEMAIKDIPEMNSRFGGIREEMITPRFRLEELATGLRPKRYEAYKDSD